MTTHQERTASVTYRPRRARVVCVVAAAAVLAVFALVATGLRGPTGDGPGVFQAGDQIAMIGLGMLAAGAILAFTRLRVDADAEGVHVRNVISRYDLPWDVVRAVTFDRGSSWAHLDLVNDEVVAVLALQTADKDHAVAGVRELRSRLAAYRSAAGPDPAREN